MILFDQLFMLIGVLYVCYILVDLLVRFDYRVQRQRRRGKTVR